LTKTPSDNADHRTPRVMSLTRGVLYFGRSLFCAWITS
jgi:hypothetical protein